MQPLNKIKEIRWGRGWSVNDVAQLSGLSNAEINKVENGQTCPTQLSMMKISKALDLEVQEVFDLNWRDKKI